MNISDIDTFNHELLSMLSCSSEKKNQYNLCLISNEELEEKCIKLTCSHKFNYNAIFQEIKNQKKHSNLEVQKIKQNQIKCPYCRNVQNGLLPSREGYGNINGINWPKKHQYLPNSCIYEFKTGKRKHEWCGKKCSDKYCPNHLRIMINREKKDNSELKNVKNNMIPSCSYIFKRGKKATTNCSCQKIFKENLCKTHYKQCWKRLSKLKKSIEKENKTNLIPNKINHFTQQNTVISI